jgi:hypothetical protein
MDFTVWKKGDKIKRRAAAESGATAKQIPACVILYDIDQVVFHSDNRI